MSRITTPKGIGTIIWLTFLFCAGLALLALRMGLVR